ncbi:MAG TPA: hypothetical protein VEG38_04880, partial [Acidimicrobiia bacterium]|nr:hypothetical protein [Acidimicrobiia bacterium]
RSVLLPAGSALAAVGIGSFAYHGPQPEWAKAAHDASIIGLALVIIGHHIWVLARFRKSRAAALRCVWTKTALWFAPALAAYWAGRTGSSLCRPASAWQYHAAWHALSAFALGVAAKSLAVGGTRRVEAGDR